MPYARALADRSRPVALVLGCAAVTAGVLLHLPMFWMARHMGFHLAGMPMGFGMILGMFLIIIGIILSAYGLLPPDVSNQMAAAHDISVAAPEDAVLSGAHWMLMLVLVIALVIDVLKPASLGFVMPGLVEEYGVTKAHAALVPFFALMGTVIGSIVWGVIADVYGRRAAILLSAIMFVGTSICGAMPSLDWNIGMCFLMGAAAGGMLPVTYALLAETMPSRQRGWTLVLVGGLGTVGGYFAASGLSAWLQPYFGWRIMWLLNLPTGLALVAMCAFIPESAKYLLAQGRNAEALAVMARFGTVSRRLSKTDQRRDFAFCQDDGQPGRDPAPSAAVGKVAALSIAAIAWGLINFGLLLWLPADQIAKGHSMAVASRLLAQSASIAFPTIFAVAFIYSRWSTKGALLSMIAVTFAGLIGAIVIDAHPLYSPVIPIALLIIGSSGLLAVLLPYTAESYPLGTRGRAAGWVAACSKLGGLFAQTLGIFALVPALGIIAGMIMVPILLAFGLILWFGTETRGLDLRDLELSPT